MSPEPPDRPIQRYSQWCAHTHKHGLNKSDAGELVLYEDHVKALSTATAQAPVNFIGNDLPLMGTSETIAGQPREPGDPSPWDEHIHVPSPTVLRYRPVGTPVPAVLRVHPSDLEEPEYVAELRAENATLTAERDALKALLVRINGWDMMDAAADGPFWRTEIARALRAASQE